MSKYKIGFTIDFRGDAKNMQFRELMLEFNGKMPHNISNILYTKRSTKVTFIFNITYEKPVPDVDGQVEWTK